MEEYIEMEGNLPVEDKYLVAKYSYENIKYISDTIKILDINPCIHLERNIFQTTCQCTGGKRVAHVNFFGSSMEVSILFNTRYVMVVLGVQAKQFYLINALILLVYISSYAGLYKLSEYRERKGEESFLKAKKKRFQDDWNNLLTIIAFLGKASKSLIFNCLASLSLEML